MAADSRMTRPSNTEVIKAALSEYYVQKCWAIASKVLTRHDPPDLYPNFTFACLKYWVYNDSSFWTSGFFPGTVWALYERSLKMNVGLSSADLLKAAKKWQVELAKEQHATDNHDLGFMIMPSFARDHDLTGCKGSLDVVVTAARSLATRFSPVTGVIRSWAGARTKKYALTDEEIDFVVVIDSMMNLDLLYYAAQHTNDKRLADIATTHATTTLENHIRADYSSYHLVSYDTQKGGVRHQKTNQGYTDDSTWARGQAWALYGFATVYQHTQEERFLDAAIKLSDKFLSRLDSDGIVYWDFDAPRPGVWDVSAAMCACSGFLLLQKLAPTRCNYLDKVLLILNTAMEQATGTGDAMFERSTANDHEHALFRQAEHGIVYADYYFVQLGNQLLELSQTNGF